LLELIAEHGSISAAGRAMGMSYRRAWLLVEDVNTTFAGRLVHAQAGGRSGGRAVLTDLGEDVLATYREAERSAAALPGLGALAARLTP
jgi:molybdate transport system regulatory protein